jgi:hypothetical protein
MVENMLLGALLSYLGFKFFLIFQGQERDRALSLGNYSIQLAKVSTVQMRAAKQQIGK